MSPAGGRGRGCVPVPSLPTTGLPRVFPSVFRLTLPRARGSVSSSPTTRRTTLPLLLRWLPLRPTVAVVAPTAAIVAPTAAVVQPGIAVRIAALQSAALGLVAMAAQPPLPPQVVGAVGLPSPPPVVAVREQEVQTDPLVFPFVFPAKGKWLL